MTASATEAVFQLCPDIRWTIFSRFYSWVAGAKGVKFLAQGNNSNRMPQLGIKPGTFRLPGRCPGNLLLPFFIEAVVGIGINEVPKIENSISTFDTVISVTFKHVLHS